MDHSISSKIESFGGKPYLPTHTRQRTNASMCKPHLITLSCIWISLKYNLCRRCVQQPIATVSGMTCYYGLWRYNCLQLLICNLILFFACH